MRDVKVRETHPFRGEAIKVRCLIPSRAVADNVAIAEVVHVNKDNVGTGRPPAGGNSRGEDEKTKDDKTAERGPDGETRVHDCRE